MSVIPRVYDYRIREQIVRTGNLDLFQELEIPRGTALTWLRRGMPDVVWLDDADADRAGLRERVVRLENVENFNAEVDELVERFDWNRIRALVDVTYSNSKIEAWWRSLKHQWLYLNQLNTLADVRRLTNFYVDQHNAVMPHSAFEGQTPDEMYYGTSSQVVEELKAKREEARRRRLEQNRRSACGLCPRATVEIGRAA